MTEKKKNSAAWYAGTLIGWFVIIGIFIGIFYFGVYIQKEVLDIYDIEKRIERLENVIINKSVKHE